MNFLLETLYALQINSPINIGTNDPNVGINVLIARVVNLGMAVAGLLFFISFFISGLQYLFAGGDEKAAASARRRLVNSFLGLVISIAAFLVSQIILIYLGVTGARVI